MSDERFSEKEVSRILREAIEADAGSGEARGLTLRQLEEIAAEVGIDPERVRATALAVRADRAAGRERGLRVTARYEVEVQGEPSRAGREEILRVVRREMDRQGIVSDDPGSFHWKARDFFGGRYLTVTSRDGRTRVEALGNFRDGVMASVGFGLPAGLAGTALILKAFGVVGAAGGVGLVAPLALVAGGALPGWFLYRRWFRREEAALRRVVTAVVTEIENEAVSAHDERPASEDTGLPGTR